MLSIASVGSPASAAHATRAVVTLAPASDAPPGVCPATIPNCPSTVGTHPVGIAFDQANQSVYVTNEDSNTVSVIDVATNTIAATLSGPGFNFSAPDAVAVNPVTNLVYVGNLRSNTVTVIDGATNTPLVSVLVGALPQGMAVDTTTGLVYVVNLRGGAGKGSVSVITGSRTPLVTTIMDASFDGPYGVAVNAQMHRVYVTNTGSTTVSVIDGLLNQVIAILPVGLHPFGVAVNTSTNMLYVTNQGNGTLSVLRADTFSPIVTLQLAGGQGDLHDVAVNEQLNHIYIMNTARAARLPNTVIVLAGAAAPANLATLPAGLNPRFAAVDPANGRVYVTDANGAAVTVIQDQPGQ